jgi:hypothetical protein
MFELGYRDLVDPVEGLAKTAQHLADHPLEPGGPEERSLSDLFDYDGEDRLIEAWQEGIREIARVALDVDAGAPDRYSATFDDSQRTGWTTVKK